MTEDSGDCAVILAVQPIRQDNFVVAGAGHGCLRPAERSLGRLVANVHLLPLVRRGTGRGDWLASEQTGAFGDPIRCVSCHRSTSRAHERGCLQLLLVVVEWTHSLLAEHGERVLVVCILMPDKRMDEASLLQLSYGFLSGWR